MSAFSLPKLPKDKIPKSSTGKGQLMTSSSHKSKPKLNFQDFDVNNISPPKHVESIKNGIKMKLKPEANIGGAIPEGLSRNIVAMDVNSNVPTLNLPSGRQKVKVSVLNSNSQRDRNMGKPNTDLGTPAQIKSPKSSVQSMMQKSLIKKTGL